MVSRKKLIAAAENLTIIVLFAAIGAGVSNFLGLLSVPTIFVRLGVLFSGIVVLVEEIRRGLPAFDVDTKAGSVSMLLFSGGLVTMIAASVSPVHFYPVFMAGVGLFTVGLYFVVRMVESDSETDPAADDDTTPRSNAPDDPVGALDDGGDA